MHYNHTKNARPPSIETAKCMMQSPDDVEELSEESVPKDDDITFAFGSTPPVDESDERPHVSDESEQEMSKMMTTHDDKHHLRNVSLHTSSPSITDTSVYGHHSENISGQNIYNITAIFLYLACFVCTSM